MKTRALKNYSASVGCEVYDIDWGSKEELIELGKLAASQCIVFVNEDIPIEKIASTMNIWGDPAGAILHQYITGRKIDGRHWREVFLTLGYTVTGLANDLYSNVSRVTYTKDQKGRPEGIFSSGELNWHSDQCAFDDAQRIIGLKSVAHSANSQTQFLCTHDAYSSMSSDMQSTVKELYCKHKWRDGVMAPGLNSVQTLVIHYNMVPLDGMETRLYSETSTGLPGIKVPSHSFDGFVGMSLIESNKILKELTKTIYQDKWVYTQNWDDGQLVFMDQEITLHKRPTNVTHGSKRSMARTISYVNKILPDNPRKTHVRVDGEMITHDELAHRVDQERLRIFNQEQCGNYASTDDAVYSHQ
jgi:alpha-ketoglutarate-dependent taurine dioxygenase